MFYYSRLLLSNFKSQVLKVLCIKFMAFPWQPLLFSYLHLSISYFICGFRLAVPALQFYCHPLCKQSLIPVPCIIIIRRLENEFDSYHLSLLNHLVQNIRLNFFFHIYFNKAQQLTLNKAQPYNWQFTIHRHLWQRLLHLIRKLRGLMDKTLASFVTEKLRFKSVPSYWQNNHSKTFLCKSTSQLVWLGGYMYSIDI